MTTIIAWAGVDGRGVSSIYIASDSRIAWNIRGQKSYEWNQGRKTFASASSPCILGYWGDVAFPSMALPTVLDQLEAGIIRPRSSAFRDIADCVRRLWIDYPEQQQNDFGIVMATRRQEAMNSLFELAIMTFEVDTATWNLRKIEMPQSSASLHVAGSGAREVRQAERLWKESKQGGTSRAVYSAFAESLAVGKDSYSGGAPQLVGLRRIGSGIRFGTVFQGKRYIAGARITQRAARRTEIDWFNEVFERVDGGRATRLQSAQRHRRR